MKVSQISGLKLICLSQAKELGAILSITVDEKMRYIKQVIVADQDEEDGFVPIRFVNFSEDIAYTINKDLEYQKTGITLPLRRAVYDTDGRYVGILDDVECLNNRITGLWIGEKCVPCGDVAVTSQQMTILKGQRQIKAQRAKVSVLKIDDSFNVLGKDSDLRSTLGDDKEDGDQSIRRDDGESKNKGKAIDDVEYTIGFKNDGKYEKTDPSETLEREKSVIASNETNVVEADESDARFENGLIVNDKYDTEEKTAEAAEKSTPAKVEYGYDFLLGRKVIRAVIADGGILIREGSVITPEIVERAADRGKLVALTVNSRKI